MNASNKLCEELVPNYKDFKPFNEKEFKGYKLAMKKNLNYYSIATGLFRYKAGKIGKSSYSSLYEKNRQYYHEKLHNRLAIFFTPEDAEEFLISYNESHPETELVLLEITLSGNLEQAVCSNTCVSDKECVIGDCMEKVKEYKSVRKPLRNEK
jgi:hypothetical protein